jgi:perosamine synthetase
LLIPIAIPLLGEAEADAARRPLLSGWVSQGPEVEAFEREFAAHVGAQTSAPHACAVSNCTTALHLALVALGVGPGDEVITASHSFIATANVIMQVGATPVFVDIEEDGHNIDPLLVEDAVTPRTRAILCVHQMGMPCDLGRLRRIADRHGLALVEDAACAAGSEIRLAGGVAEGMDGEWRRIGDPVGDIVCFSFHPRKVITTGEGGMLTTRDSGLDARFRLLRQHGMDLSDRARHLASSVAFESYVVPGFNYRMTDIQAAVGRCQLARLPGIVARRRELADGYRTLLTSLAPEVRLPSEPAWARSNWQSYCVRLPDVVNRNAVMQRMMDDGIATRRGIMCAHREPAYAGAERRHALPRSEEAQDSCLILPLYPQMTEDDLERVAHSLSRAVDAQMRRGRAVTI